MSLVDILEQLEYVDDEMEKEASEMEKFAAEEEAAGRIMARGFMDELNKIAQRQPGTAVPPPPKVPAKGVGAGTVVSPGPLAGTKGVGKKLKPAPAPGTPGATKPVGRF